MAASAKLIEAYLQGPDDLRAAVKDLSKDQLAARPVVGRMTTLEVLCHLADFEAVFADRMKRIIALGESPLLLAADENLYLRELHYEDRDAEVELALIEATRKQMSRILRPLTSEQFQKPGVHSLKGLLPLEKVVQGAVNHILHHLPFIHEKRKALGR